ncbi:glycolipid 2-alpha-mannosyltransferase [Verticillium dahliae VdLs.17]|uniref:Glycolipid 2-alpha-mannosyltransferase n=1 Tax=Verticillium dahliae (strain VdLs.17 / ATCC MYA-4575 / FGSC 10137) TaxID=498257 RepID=G2XE38_VERDV|nr:glycolipid 2-alpha-mannosyltransferase [Verticillium dahliae VdLs.17]EGY18086.1 glycolipid 2-alpha-mannosyltransferase [Verticillium dahliae VdLs.17]
MAMARPIRALVVVSVMLWCFFIYLILGPQKEIHLPERYSHERDPNLDLTGEPEGTLTYASEAYAPGIENSARINATLLALVRNEELPGMLSSMRDLERTWNHKFNYPWTFFNDVPFTDEFKRRTAAATKAEVRYEVIPKEHWDMPSWINKDLYHESTKMLKENGIQYADKVSYHSMCRWNSGMFYKHPALATTRYYWRVEPKVHFFCDVDYDVFRYMHDNNKTTPRRPTATRPATSGATLRLATWTFGAASPTRTTLTTSTAPAASSTSAGATPPSTASPSACLRTRAGFTGGIPVFFSFFFFGIMVLTQHRFRDIGYQHIPFFNCPNSPKCRGCKAGKFTDGENWLHREDCRPNWFKYVGMG